MGKALVHYAQTPTSRARDLIANYGAEEAKSMLGRWIARGDSLELQHRATLRAFEALQARAAA